MLIYGFEFRKMVNKLTQAKEQARKSGSTIVVDNDNIQIHVTAISNINALLHKFAIANLIGLFKIDDNTEFTDAELRLANHIKVNQQYLKKQQYIADLIENYHIQLSNYNSEAEKYADIYNGLVEWFTSIDFAKPHIAANRKLYAVTSQFDPEWEDVLKFVN